jgi:hypothetical protein
VSNTEVVHVPTAIENVFMIGFALSWGSPCYHCPSSTRRENAVRAATMGSWSVGLPAVSVAVLVWYGRTESGLTG